VKNRIIEGNDRGELIYTADKEGGLYVLLVVSVVALLLGIYIIVISTMSSRYLVSVRVLIVVILICVAVRYIVTLSMMGPFRIYEKGFTPAQRTWKEWLFRRDAFIPYDEIVEVEIVYKKNSSQGNFMEPSLEPRNIRCEKIHTKNGNVRSINFFWFDEEAERKFLEILKKKGILKKEKEAL